MTLTEFLLARIAEDEAIAKEPQGYVYAGSLSRTFTPTRVLAECEAKRRIVEEHPDYGGCGKSCATCAESDIDLTPWPCPTLRALALPYADHEDCRQEWKP